MILSSVGAKFQALKRQLDGSDAREREHRMAIQSYNFRVGSSTAVMASQQQARLQEEEQSGASLSSFQPCLTLADIRSALPPMFAQASALRRVEVALQTLIKSGQVWIDVDPTHQDVRGSLVEPMTDAFDEKTVKTKASALTKGQFSFKSAGYMSAESNADDGFTIISKGEGGKISAAPSKQGPSSADVLEHPAVKYWFVAFL